MRKSWCDARKTKQKGKAKAKRGESLQQDWQTPKKIMNNASESGMSIDLSIRTLKCPDPGLSCGEAQRRISYPRSHSQCSSSTSLSFNTACAISTTRSTSPDSSEADSTITKIWDGSQRGRPRTRDLVPPSELASEADDTAAVDSIIARRMSMRPHLVKHKPRSSLEVISGRSGPLQQDPSVEIHNDTLDMSDGEEESQHESAHGHTNREPLAYQTWATDRPWDYCQWNDLLLQINPSVELPVHLRPVEWLPQEGETSARSLFPSALPFLTQGNVPGKIPKLQYDATWNRILVTPHSQPYTDIRQLQNHPDYLPAPKLLQYQAMEIAGWPVWRHDRNSIRCCKPGCTINTHDHDVSTQICLGCGPCSGIRYCSKAHMLSDLKGHWKECGHIENLMPYFMDEDTRPGRFARRYPFIADISETSSFEKHRQRHYYILNKGQYTVFRPGSTPFTVVWPTPELKEMYVPRVERLMNAAFFDQTRENVVGCLFYHVRMALRINGLWDRSVAETLRVQFKREFDWNTAGAFEEDQCECVWIGDEADERRCTASCTHAQIAAGGIRRGQGIRKLLEHLEACNFLLRVWQRQHPTIKGWQTRLSGKGFAGAKVRDLSKERPLFGKGWNGMGSAHLVGSWENL